MKLYPVSVIRYRINKVEKGKPRAGSLHLWRLIGVFLFGLILFYLVSCISKTNPHYEKSRKIISKYQILFNKPPQKIPMPYSVDAPLLGNGDMAVAIGGDPEKISFWLSKNDFWRLKSEHDRGYFSGIGHLDIEIPGLKNADFLIRQNLYKAQTTAILSNDDTILNISCFVAATKNLLVIEIAAETGTFEGKVSIHSIQGGQSESLRGKSDTILWLVRKFDRNVDIPTAVAVALTSPNFTGQEFIIKPGEKIRLYLGMESLFKDTDYLEEAKNLVNEVDIKAIERVHLEWWQDYWAQSYVQIGESIIEKYYYQSLYTMGSCSRDPEFPPSLFGTWITTNKPWWGGDYHLNYNHMAPFYGLYSSNRIEQALPYVAPVLDFHERGQYYANKVCGIDGVLYPVGIGPKGIETTRKSPTEKRNSFIKAYEDEGMFWGQKSNAAYCVTNISAHFYHTYDSDYAQKVYPFVMEVACFWENYLVFENGHYNIYNDAIHEGTYGTKNPILSLGLVPMVLQTAIDMSVYLEQNLNKIEEWGNILKKMPPYPLQIKDGEQVFRYSEEGTSWWNDNTLGIQHIYPAGQIGLDSDPHVLEISRNTIEIMDRWLDYNGTNSFYPAAVRVGYDPKTILMHLSELVQNTYPNGFQKNNPHGIENCSTVPNTINEMLCMGHQNVLRVFPVWPKSKNASFANIRIPGAFLVSSNLKNGSVTHIDIISEKGRICTIVNPWPGKRVVLQRNEGVEEILNGGRLVISTSIGERLSLQPN